MTLRNPHRRIAAVLAGAVLGLAAGSPAQAAATGELTATVSCTADGWDVEWKLTTAETGGAEAVLSQPHGGVEVHIQRGGPPEQGPSPTILVGGAKVAGDTVITEELSYLPNHLSATIGFTLTWTDEDQVHTKDLRTTAQAPTDCTWKPPTTPQTPGYIVSRTCDLFVVTLNNPRRQYGVVKLHLKTSKGDQFTLVAEPGRHTAKTFSEAPGFAVEVTPEDFPPPPGKWTVDPREPKTFTFQRPADCDTPTGNDTTASGGAGGGGDSLPVTGAATGTLAALLLATGAILFATARRRRTRFTA